MAKSRIFIAFRYCADDIWKGKILTSAPAMGDDTKNG